MERQIYLAYDGSINADWISRYAIQMAATLHRRKIVVIHIRDGSSAYPAIERKLTKIAAECEELGIECQNVIHPLEKNVSSSLLRVIPSGEHSYCLCGARIASRGRGFLAGTVAERLLRSKKFNVMAIRVVSPGLLGCPKTLLFPLAGHPRGFEAAMPFLRMFSFPLVRLHLLRVMNVNPFHFRYIAAEAVQKKLAEGRKYLGRIMSEIREEISEANRPHLHLDRHVVLSDDWAKEILIQAGRVRASMILLGASDRNLPSRFFYGNKFEQILRNAPCDVGIYRKL